MTAVTLLGRPPMESMSGRFAEVIIFLTACRCREGVCTVTKNQSSEPLIM